MDNFTNQEKQKILVQMNFPAPPITKEDMEKILTGGLEDIDLPWVMWLENFLGLPRTSFVAEILERFREINTRETFMSIVPSIQKLLKPLRDSCKAYCLGLYSASIALSAVEAESLQILLWEIHGIKLNSSEMTEVQEKAIFGRRFERIEQSRRIEILSSFGWITEDQNDLFHRIRGARNRYLHSWSEDFNREKEEALLCYRDVFKLFREITAVKLKDSSSIEANPLLTQWMQKTKN
ncbi:MAG: hypothetical protein NTY11_02615 [Candidatus Parcubacteria bacterium]|nr:hypothetical protein [Candidatus Parcubacteria bacterium]